MRGAFITFEGIDGCGKSTQAGRLVQALRDAGRDVVATREPGGTPVADAVRAAFLEPSNAGMAAEAELLLMCAGRADHVRRVIAPALERGAVVVCDRFHDSTHAYQGAGRGLPARTIDAADAIARGGVVPDVTLLLDLEAERATERSLSRPGAHTRLDAESLAFHRRIRSAFLRRAGDEPDRVWVVDASGDADDTWHRVRSVVARALPGLLA